MKPYFSDEAKDLLTRLLQNNVSSLSSIYFSLYIVWGQGLVMQLRLKDIHFFQGSIGTVLR